MLKPSLRSVIGVNLCLLIASCSAGGEEQGLLPVRPDQQTGGTGNTPSGAGGQGAPSTNVTGPDFDLDDDSATAAGCQQAERKFVPKIPAVFVLVDRSGTMFDTIPSEGGQTVTPWGSLRVGVLEVMRELESAVSFGFGAFSGKPAGGATRCELDAPGAQPKVGNYTTIASIYEPLERPTDPDSKETPTLLALANAAKQLRETPTEGERYILFVTDGEPDYCDNGNNLCPPDSVVRLLQDLAAGVDRTGAPQPPIQTFVFGISSPSANIQESALQNFANAGAGLPVAYFTANPTPTDPNYFDPTYDQCAGVPGWSDDFDTTGQTRARGATIGSYVADPTLAGNAPVFRPDPLDQAALTEQIRTALAGVKSCTFDLGEDGVKVDLSRLDLGEKAKVLVNGTAVAFDATNGWSMLSETTVALAGEACTAWRSPTIETSISFDFPCDIFVPR